MRAAATSSSAAPCPPRASWTISSTSPNCTASLHCLDAKTGKHFWQYDTKASIWGSPYYVDGKICLATTTATSCVFKHEKKHDVYDELEAAKNAEDMKSARAAMKKVRDAVEKKYLISKTEFDATIRRRPSSPTACSTS